MLSALSPTLRELIQGRVRRLAQAEDIGEPQIYLGQAFFDQLRFIHEQLERHLPVMRGEEGRLQALKQEILQTLNDHYRERNFPDMTIFLSDRMARSTRPEIDDRIRRFPLALRESLRFRMRQMTSQGHDLEDMDPVLYLHQLGRLMGSTLRRYYLQVYAEGLSDHLVRRGQLPWSWDSFSHQQARIQESVHRGRPQLQLSSLYMERMRMLEGLIQQVHRDWGELHPLFEGFTLEFFEEVEPSGSLVNQWEIMGELSRNLERIRRLDGHELFPQPHINGWRTSPGGEPTSFFDPTSSFFESMPESLRDLVFGDLEFLGHQFVASPNYAMAQRLVEVLVAARGGELPRDIRERGHSLHDLERAAQWIRTQMVHLYRGNREFYDRLLGHYFESLAEASQVNLLAEMQELPRELLPGLHWRPEGTWDENQGPVKDLHTRGMALGYMMRLAVTQMLQFGESRGLFDLEAAGLDRAALEQVANPEEIPGLGRNLQLNHLQAIEALDAFILRVHYQWGNYHPLIEGFCEQFPEHDVLGPQSRTLRTLRGEVEDYLRQREEPH